MPQPADLNLGSPASPPAYVAGHHWVSPFNFAPEAQAGLAFADPMTLVDSTLRKIITTTGVRPSMDRMLEVAAGLVDAGLKEMILNVYWFGEPVPSRVELDVAREVFAARLPVNITVSCDALVGAGAYGPAAPTIPLPAVLDTLEALGARSIAVEGMGARTESAAQRDARFERIAGIFAAAGERGMTCALHLGDPGRREFDRVLETANHGLALGAFRIDVSDSFNSLSPEGMKLFIRSLIEGCTRRVPVSVHVHNDFGLATASALAAASAGALPDVSVNGTSYKAGFAALEEIAVALEVLYGVRSGIRLERLQALSDLVEKAMGFPRQPMKAITGSYSRLRNRPLWIIEYLEGEGFPPAASCFPPSLVGTSMSMVWDNNPSNAVIGAKLHSMGLPAGESEVREVRARINALLESKTAYPYLVDEAEIEAICREVAGCAG